MKSDLGGWLFIVFYLAAVIFMFVFAGDLTGVNDMSTEDFDKYTSTLRP